MRLNSDSLYEWVEEHLIIPNRVYWYEKMAEGDWHRASELNWFLARVKGGTELKAELIDFCRTCL